MMRTLNEADDGQTTTIRPGEAIALELPENPTTGYRWTVELSGDALAQAASTYMPGAGIGAGGQRSTTFTALRPGTTVIRASLRRPWEAPDRTLKTFEATVHVAA
jgi:inhibitor of cysteine peptidase